MPGRFAAIGPALCLAFVAVAAAEDAPVVRLDVSPRTAVLEDPRAYAQLVVTGIDAAGEVRDLTTHVRFQSQDGIAKVDASGVVRPLKSGQGRIKIVAGNINATVNVEVRTGLVDPQVRFRREVMALLSKAGCNQGTCHGNFNGKGGFRLSLRGEDAGFDWRALTHDAAARRVDPASPERSLAVLKPTGLLPHEGGRRFAADSRQAQTLLDWIKAGALDDAESVAKVAAVSVYPAERVSCGGELSQHLRVTAQFTDGSLRDVTQECAYDVSDPAHAVVSPEGEVRVTGPCEISVQARYLEGRAVSQLAFLPVKPGYVWSNPPAFNPIDALVAAKWKRMKAVPSELATDSVFLRRAFLDALGELPTPEETKAFLSDRSPEKRNQLIARLVQRPEFAEYWALKWSDLLKNEEKTMGAKGVWTFHRWLRDRIDADLPLSDLATVLITSKGSSLKNPEASFYRTNRDPSTVAETFAQVFLGYRFQCARCHNHPFDAWTQDDYYGLAAYFSNIKYKQINNKRRDELDKHEINGDEIVYLEGAAEMVQPRSGRRLEPRPPRKDGGAAQGGSTREPEGDPRRALAAWLVAEDPQFARNMANRVWFHMMGRGIVEPVDDFRDSNPPSNPPLLDHLTDYFKSHELRIKPLVEYIMKSRTYQLDSRPAAPGDSEDAVYARAKVRLLDAEVLLDAIGSTLGARERIKNAPSAVGAVQYPGVMTGESFLKTFGKPERLLTCECERSEATTLAQAFQLINGPAVRRMLESPANRLGSALARGATDERILDELYLAGLCRPPSSAERERALEHLSKPGDRRALWEDLAWAVVNSKEFLLRH